MILVDLVAMMAEARVNPLAIYRAYTGVNLVSDIGLGSQADGRLT